ncbi:serine/threonine-protein kinase TOR, partial [Kipferlia bialata]
CHAYAKAIRHREDLVKSEDITSTAQDVIPLVSLYRRVGHHGAAQGLLLRAKELFGKDLAETQQFKLDGGVLAAVEEWEEALPYFEKSSPFGSSVPLSVGHLDVREDLSTPRVSQRERDTERERDRDRDRHQRGGRVTAAVRGQLRCLFELGRWSEFLPFLDKCDSLSSHGISGFPLSLGGTVIRSRRDRGERERERERLAESRLERAELQAIKTEVALAVAESAVLTGRHELLTDERVLQHLPTTSLKGLQLLASASVVKRDFVNAKKLIDKARSILDGVLVPLVSESYGRAYPGLVTAQSLGQLEETILYLQIPPSVLGNTHKKHLRETWTRRLAAAEPEHSVWREILGVRSLALKPQEDVPTILRYVEICRLSGSTEMALRYTLSLMGLSSNPLDRYDLAVRRSSRSESDLLMMPPMYDYSMFSAGPDFPGSASARRFPDMDFRDENPTRIMIVDRERERERETRVRETVDSPPGRSNALSWYRALPTLPMDVPEFAIAVTEVLWDTATSPLDKLKAFATCLKISTLPGLREDGVDTGVGVGTTSTDSSRVSVSDKDRRCAVVSRVLVILASWYNVLTQPLHTNMMNSRPMTLPSHSSTHAAKQTVSSSSLSLSTSLSPAAEEDPVYHYKQDAYMEADQIYSPSLREKEREREQERDRGRGCGDTDEAMAAAKGVVELVDDVCGPLRNPVFHPSQKHYDRLSSWYQEAALFTQDWAFVKRAHASVDAAVLDIHSSLLKEDLPHVLCRDHSDALPLSPIDTGLRPSIASLTALERSVEHRARSAIRGLRDTLLLDPSSDSTLPAVLQLLGVWFGYGERDSVSAAVADCIRALPQSTWLPVIPQIIAHLDDDKRGVRSLVSELLYSVGVQFPGAVTYSLGVVARKDRAEIPSLLSPSYAYDRERERERERAGMHPETHEVDPMRERERERPSLSLEEMHSPGVLVLARLRAIHPALVDQVLLIGHELIRISFLLPELWHDEIDQLQHQFSKTWNLKSERLRSLDHLYGNLENASTPDEVHFFQRFGSRLLNARELLLQYLRTQDRTHASAAMQLYLELQPEMKEYRSGIQNSTMQLGRVSPVLAESVGLCAPLPGSTGIHPVTVYAFSATLKVMHGIHRPRKISLIGSDGMRYVYCLKMGEDTRLDERVQQALGLVNSALSADYFARRRSLMAVTYPVIPLSPICGLLHWVPDSDTISDIISDIRTKFQPHRLSNGEFYDPAILNAYMGPVSRGGTAPLGYDQWPLPFRMEAFQQMQVQQKKFSSELAIVLWLRSHSSEAWLKHRVAFSHSVAVMSCVGYILGLGDRHPRNIMLQRRSGNIVHIDYGDSFERTMHRSVHPERVPFRMTRIITDALEPGGTWGTFRLAGEATLRVMRKNRDSLTVVLEAFLHDPLTEWNINIVPKHVNVELLTPAQLQMMRVSAVLDRVRAKLTGDDFPRLGTGLSVSKQLQRLIRSATSIENLCQAWVGWSAWV